MLRPEPGLIVKYEMQFSHNIYAERLEGEQHPALVLVAKEPDERGVQRVLLAPISHSEPHDGDMAVALPAADAAKIGLDRRQMWVKLDELTSIGWPSDRHPVGLREITPGSSQYAYPGSMPEDTLEGIASEADAAMQRGKTRVWNMEKVLERYDRQISNQEHGKPEHELDQADDD